ncbi:MAG: hypothetical protein O3C20_22660, partial [Verrucomicrobia bacterium]|nr:hypothetical protein [Verrucomicrobiota bacterium]
ATLATEPQQVPSFYSILSHEFRILFKIPSFSDHMKKDFAPFFILQEQIYSRPITKIYRG